MNAAKLFTSSVGKKFIMAVTGLALFLFVFLHLAGNLQIFLGWEELNRYGAFLQGNVELLWPARIGLLVIVSLHIWSAIQLTVENRAARPQPYARHEVVAASYASRTMFWSGLIIAAFVIYHLLHFTAQVQAINLTGRNFTELQDAKGRHDVFAMMVLAFQKPLVAGFYILAMFLLCLHLSHGLSAMFQSLGWKSPAYAPWIDRSAAAISWLIFLGYVSIPLSILIGGLGRGYLQSRGLLP
jgi:succinate dehydrogenase / fumarate reductase, cytochrome b subunit